MSEMSIYDELLLRLQKEKSVEVIEKEDKVIVRETIDYYIPTDNELIDKSCVENLYSHIKNRIEAEKIFEEEERRRIREGDYD